MSASPIDLTTVAAVKAWSGVLTSNDDSIIQDTITALSLYLMHLTGRGPADGSVPTSSPFNTQVAYDEFYDGNGNNELPLRNWPIVSVAAVIDTGITIPASGSTTSPGYVVDQSKKFLVIRAGGGLPYAPARGGRYSRCGWTLGTQNIEVQYTAGFSATPFDLEMCARKVASLNYKRRQRIDQKAQAMAAGAGTISFYDWEMDNQDRRVIDYYAARVA